MSTIVLKINRGMFPLKLTKKQKRELDASIEEMIKECKSHFRRKNHGWPLSLPLYQSIATNDALGDLSGYVWASLVEAGFKLDLASDTFAVNRRKKKKK